MEINNDERFINDLIKRTGQKNIRNRIHYYSFLNVKNGLKETYNSELNQRLISKLNEYETIILNLDKPVNRLKSHDFYKNYIYPAGYHLERKEKYKYVSKYDLYVKIIIGLILDLVIWFMFDFGLYFPVLTLILIIVGIKKRENAKKNKRFFGQYY